MEPLREEALLLTAEKIRANAINSLRYLIRALRIDDGKDYTDDELRQMRRDLGDAVQAFNNFFETMSYETRLAWQEAPTGQIRQQLPIQPAPQVCSASLGLFVAPLHAGSLTALQTVR